MIVDDEKPCLEDLSFLLSHCDGIEISGAFTHPEEALAAVKALRPDVLFLDLKMPKLSGAELARKALALLPDLRLVFVTAYTKELENVRGLPVFGSLLKPVGNTKLNELMDRLRADQI
jgi:two-component system LytT family response regulator/two-component system response regulator LytT